MTLSAKKEFLLMKWELGGIREAHKKKVAISWSQHESIVWAIIQGFFSWFYVIYFAFTRPGGLAG